MKIKNRQQLLGILAVGVVAIFATDKLVISPLTASWNKRSSRIEELRKKVDDGRRLIGREAGLRARWQEMQSRTLPANRAVAEQQILNAVDGWAQESRITVTSISPQWKRDSDDYMTLECRLEAAGSMGSISQFLYKVEKSSLPIKVQALELSAKDNEGQQMVMGVQISGLLLTGSEPQSRS